MDLEIYQVSESDDEARAACKALMAAEPAFEGVEPDELLWAVKDGDKIVGTAGAVWNSDTRDMVLTHCVLPPELRGKKIQRTLIAKRVNLARGRGALTVQTYVSVKTGVPSLINLLKCGFTIVDWDNVEHLTLERSLQ